MVINNAELWGFISLVLILISMCFKTDTFRGTMLLRGFNLAGSVTSICYGFMLADIAESMIILNSLLLIINAYHMIKEVIKNSKKKNEPKDR